MNDMTLTERQTIERRSFLKRALVLAWSTPIILTIASEHALAQTVACGKVIGASLVCSNSPACTAASTPRCCATSSVKFEPCNCYSSTTAPGVVASTCV